MKAKKDIRILVVDKEEGVRRVISLVLEPEGYHVTTVSDCEEAVEAIHRDSFDLVTTALEMRNMSGLEFLRIVKRISPDTPILVVTVRSLPEFAKEAFKAGARGYILKPFSPDEFKASVKKILKSKKLIVLPKGMHMRQKRRDKK